MSRVQTLVQNSHADISAAFVKAFDWIVLQPGPGHIEMNMLKTYLKPAWDVYWEEMIELYNFK